MPSSLVKKTTDINFVCEKDIKTNNSCTTSATKPKLKQVKFLVLSTRSG